MAMLDQRDLRDALRAARAAWSWPIFWSSIAIFSLVGLLAWLGANADPRYEDRCSDPGDFAFVMFFLSLPVIGSCALVGLGECVLWSRNREARPQIARSHLRRACTLLAIAAVCCAAVALGFLGLCRFI